jgi:hypothetical protein
MQFQRQLAAYWPRISPLFSGNGIEKHTDNFTPPSRLRDPIVIVNPTKLDTKPSIFVTALVPGLA